MGGVGDKVRLMGHWGAAKPFTKARSLSETIRGLTLSFALAQIAAKLVTTWRDL